jgi:hypothetical protein
MRLLRGNGCFVERVYCLKYIAYTTYSTFQKFATLGSRVRFPAGAGSFSLHHSVQIGSGAHPAFYPVSTRSSFPGIKRPGRKADH